MKKVTMLLGLLALAGCATSPHNDDQIVRGSNLGPRDVPGHVAVPERVLPSPEPDIAPVLFAKGRAEVSAEALAGPVAELAAWMKRYPRDLVIIEGHASSEGNAKANLRLSVKRANAVKAQLSKLGVEKSRIETAGYGADRPAVPNTSEANRAQNRRAVFHVTLLP